jgi:hypothetical protein
MIHLPQTPKSVIMNHIPDFDHPGLLSTHPRPGFLSESSDGDTSKLQIPGRPSNGLQIPGRPSNGLQIPGRPSSSSSSSSSNAAGRMDGNLQSTSSSSMYVKRETLFTQLQNLIRSFFSNLDKTEKQNVVKMFFRLEKAHWHYIDNYCKKLPVRSQIPLYRFEDFAKHLVRLFPELFCDLYHASEEYGNASKKRHLPISDAMISRWLKMFRHHKDTIPVYGCICIDQDGSHVLMCRPCGCDSWSFPKGKLESCDVTNAKEILSRFKEKLDTNVDEVAGIVCALRELKEETGIVLPEQFMLPNSRTQCVFPTRHNEKQVVNMFL